VGGAALELFANLNALICPGPMVGAPVNARGVYQRAHMPLTAQLVPLTCRFSRRCGGEQRLAARLVAN
jgi:hypothetical protein